VTQRFLSKFPHRAVADLAADADAQYVRIIDLDIGTLKCLVAMPSTPDNVCEVSALSAQPIKVDQVFIGSCTNGRIEDMRQAAEILGRGEVHPSVRLIVTPGTQEIFTQMAASGLLELFSRAGAAVTPATCGACVGGHMGILGDGEVCLSTSNRNFVGRMGSSSARVYLCNPYVAAASALKGHICGPDEL
jgi:3-isopropylmalate/(R)-2-methylmalate dehydratase large subunit